MSNHNRKDREQKNWIRYTALPALGVVFGDIGTSPLYSLRECLNASSGEPTSYVVLGILSLIFWSITFVISIKYVHYIMRADNDGEGGIMALFGLALNDDNCPKNRRPLILLAGLAGAALFYGDGMITPAISVLSAVEGIELVDPEIADYIVPISIVILLALFLFQKKGTDGIGGLFGPIMLLWFLTLGGIGTWHIIESPIVFSAMNPLVALEFLVEHKSEAFVILGAVVLSVTGAEALYADMGHFGAKPIRATWYYLVFPALILNYFGQGAHVIAHPEAVKNPFFLMFPKESLPYVITLATIATIIASQAVITGAFSLTQQALQLGFLPRMQVIHTSRKNRGQIYLPVVNHMLLVGVILLVVGFQCSTNLASAYGIAITGTMLMTTILFTIVAKVNWNWPTMALIPLSMAFALVDFLFLGANFCKFFDGGWLPVMIGVGFYLVMSTWMKGQTLVYHRIAPHVANDLASFIQEALRQDIIRVPGTAVYLADPEEAVPNALVLNLRHYRAIHQTVVILTIDASVHPRALPENRMQVTPIGDGIFHVRARYGFMEYPIIPSIVRRLKDRHDVPIDLDETSYYVSRLQPIPSDLPGMVPWREKFYVFLLKNSAEAYDFFEIPYDRVVELNMRFKI
jgi:KUP system potassium uptake protein